MTFKQIIDSYLVELKIEVRAADNSGEATAELSFRTSLDNFFKNVAAFVNDEIVTIPEPKNQNKIGRPDWRFHNSETMGVYGYVESKGIDPINKINVSLYRGQVDKYLTLGNPVILTDGIDFILFTPDGRTEIYSVCNKPLNWSNLDPHLDIEILFQKFFKKSGYRSISENQLVNEVAKRAKLLTDEVLEFLNLDEDETVNNSELDTLNALKNLKQVAETYHDKTLASDNAFASFIAQILTFGLLYAHRVVDKSCDTPSEKYNRIHDFWFSYLNEDYSSKLLPFKMLVRGLESEINAELSRLGLWYNDLRRLLSHIKLTSEQIDLPDFHELYETFLSIYDPNARFDYGAFYTPRSLAFHLVEFAKKIVEVSFPHVDLQLPGHKFIDPCCGTGTLIEALLKTINPSSDSKIIGFEILPAPYALAHYRMAMIKDEYPNNVQIILTNTLSDNLFELNDEDTKGDSMSSLLLREQQVAYHLADPPLTLIIGNPPSSDSKLQIENEGNQIKVLMEDFRPSIENRTSRQNVQKQLSNEYVKFLRWTVDRALKSSPCLFVLILPSSFAKHASYKFARKYLIEQFSELWITEFDSDNRAGIGDSNIFRTLQGRLILAGVFKESSCAFASLKYKSIKNLSQKDKIVFLENKDINLSSWENVSIEEDTFSLKPTESYDKETYDKFWDLSNDDDSGIFYRHCSSLKLAPTHLLVHASKGQLKRRSKFIAKAESTYKEIIDNWYSGQKKPPAEAKITQNIKSKIKDAISRNSIISYSYRPFIEMNVLLNDDIMLELQNLAGGGTRDRPEVRAAFSNDTVFGFAVSPAPEDIGATLHKFSSFCWHTPDNDLCARGNAHIFCNYFPEYKKKKDWNTSIKSNINFDLIQTITSDFKLKEDEIIACLTFYTYAILSSEYYMTKFSSKLFNVAGGGWPKIPITKNREYFLDIAKLGKVLAKLESKNYGADSKSLEINEITYFKYSFVNNNIHLKDKDGLILKTYTSISDDVLSFAVSGYAVIKEWLKLHSYPYYRKGISNQEFTEFESLISKVTTYNLEVQKIDKIVAQLLNDELYEVLR